MLYVVALILALFSTQASAADYTCDYAGSQRQMNACAIQEYKEAFKDYTLTYQRTLHAMTTQGQAALKAKSDAWAKVARLQCLRSSRHTGSDETILFYTCLQQLVEHRNLWLRSSHTQV